MLALLEVLAEFAFVVLVATLAVLLKTIDTRGFLASVAVGMAIIYGGGVSWFAIVAAFFVLGVAVTFYRYGYKKKLGGAQEKGGARNWPNILANGGMASLFSIGEILHPWPGFSALFLGAVSTSAADTAATELGLLSRSRPRLLTRPSSFVQPGSSGGVTPRGFGGAALACLVIGGLAFALRTVPGAGLAASAGLGVIGVCVFGGVAGSVGDSLMGAVVQRKGRCPVCLKPTEALRHCGEGTMVERGVPFVENNVVNAAATVVGGVAALALALAVRLV